LHSVRTKLARDRVTRALRCECEGIGLPRVVTIVGGPGQREADDSVEAVLIAFADPPTRGQECRLSV
jgi:hypothetical protein